MTKEKEVIKKGIPWRDSSTFVVTYYSILTAMVGAILALAIGDPEIKNSWYLPVGLLALSMMSFILGLEKYGEAVDEDDVDKYLTWLLIYNLGTIAMFFGIATYIVRHYRPTWAIFFAVLISAAIASRKWLCDILFLLFAGDANYDAYREELLGNRRPEKDPDWQMYVHGLFRSSQRRFRRLQRKRMNKSLPDTECFTRLQQSDIHGIGVFAIRDIPKGTNIFNDDMSEMEWIDASEVLQKSGEIRRLYDDFCVLHKGKYGCPKGFNNLTVAWYLNQPPLGQEPNVICDDKYDFLAAREIRAGEELTVDYSTYSDNPELDAT